MRKATICVILVFILIFVSPTCFAYGPTEFEHDHLYYIQNQNSGKYLTVNGNNIEQRSLSYNQNQRFFVRFIKSSDGFDYYSFIPDCCKGYKIDVENAWDINGANIGIYGDNTYVPSAQNFRFILNSNLRYQIMPEVSSTRVFDVANASTLDGANIALFTRRSINDSLVTAQQFKLYTVELSVMSYNCVDSSKHLDYSCESMFSDCAEFAKDTWNGYKAGVVRKYIPIIRPKDISIIGKQTLPAGIAGITYFVEKEIHISIAVWDTLTGNQRNNLVIHEIGHALGMGHIDDTSNVLYYAVNSTISLESANRDSYDFAYSQY
jgi:hypothetical protein